jgi:hypothetical protein
MGGLLSTQDVTQPYVNWAPEASFDGVVGFGSDESTSNVWGKMDVEQLGTRVV